MPLEDAISLLSPIHFFPFLSERSASVRSFVRSSFSRIFVTVAFRLSGSWLCVLYGLYCTVLYCTVRERCML